LFPTMYLNALLIELGGTELVIHRWNRAIRPESRPAETDLVLRLDKRGQLTGDDF
jgi:hypothetical protein